MNSPSSPLLTAKKSLGQHFLLDPHLCDTIAKLGGDLREQHIVEIGPGPAGLTKALLRQGAKSVHAVEIDQRAYPLLEALAEQSEGRLTLMKGDALKLDAAALCPAPRQLIANLPYNVASPLLVRFLRQASLWKEMTLMFQLEVAERICAAPNDSAYGRLGVLAQWCAECKIVMRLPPGAFSPPPKVHSAIVKLIPHAQQPSETLFRQMEALTLSAFGQRRKMLRSALKKLGGAALLEQIGIDPQRRGETLSISEFDAIARHLHAQKGKA